MYSPNITIVPIFATRMQQLLVTLRSLGANGQMMAYSY